LIFGPHFESAWNDLIDDVCKEHDTLSSRWTNFLMQQN
jgi:hypothetical protein